MAGIVLDSSVVTASILHEEEERERVGRTMEATSTAGAWVPQLWHLEIRNSLLVAERRNRLSQDETTIALTALLTLPIRTDDSPDFAHILAIARRGRLSFYDAVYVELAVRLDAQLATLDSAMARAAEAEGVSIG